MPKRGHPLRDIGGGFIAVTRIPRACPAFVRSVRRHAPLYDRRQRSSGGGAGFRVDAVVVDAGGTERATRVRGRRAVDECRAIRARRTRSADRFGADGPGMGALTDYVSTMPSRLAARYCDTLDIFDLPFEARGFTIFAAWHPRSQLDPASVWLRETLIWQGNEQA